MVTMNPDMQIRQSGKPLEKIMAWGKVFDLVTETNWSLVYKHNDYLLNISKVATGLLESSLLKKSPEELSCDERSDAAVSLYGFGDGSDYLPFKIPNAWIRFSEKYCKLDSVHLYDE